MIKIPSNIHLINTLWLRVKHVINNTELRNIFGVLIYGKVKTDLHTGASIVLNKGRLDMGKHWTKKAVFPSLLSMADSSRLIVNGSFCVFDNTAIYINKGAVLELGSGFINSRANISCFKKITIGNNVVISEGVTMRDSDNHQVVGSQKSVTETIEIKDNVWIGMNVTILKGVTIGEGSVIAAGATVVNDVPSHTLVGGVPAKVIKTQIEWIR